MRLLEVKITAYNAQRYIYEFEEQVQGQKLVTNAVILFTRMIQPLIWSHPKILSLPKSKLQLLCAPFPLIVGLNMSPNSFYNGNSLQLYKSSQYSADCAYDLVCKNEDLLTVFLNKNEMKASKLEILIPLKMRKNMYNPYFASKKSKMQALYSDYYFGNKSTEDRTSSDWIPDDGTVEKVLLSFREILYEFFIKPLPLDPLYKTTS
jgi:hypothetical protein